MAEKLEIKQKNPFSGWPMFFAWAAVLIFAGHSITHMVGAGDTWVAMACGRHFLNQGFKDVTVEPFSANSHEAGPTVEGMNEYAQMLRGEAQRQRRMADPDYFNSQIPREGNPVVKGSNFKAFVLDEWADFADSYENWPEGFKSFAKWIHPTGWVNQNWLTHVIFYWLTHDAFGSEDEPFYNALVYWKLAIYIILAVCVYFSARIMGVTNVLAAAAACLAVFVGRSFYDVRPAGFSNMLTGVLLLIYVLTLYKNYRYIWLLVPLMIFWSNVHGGFIYVFITLVPFIGTNFLLMLNKKWRIIAYSAGALLLFIYTLMKVAGTNYIAAESQKVFLGILGLGLLLIVGGFVFAKYRERFIFLPLRGLIHTVAASAVTLVAVLFLNPFKLTNFTHTLIVSISEHAEMWRQVHEWHPAFAWSNPVGTAVPFMIALVGLIGFGAVCLIGYIYRARLEGVNKVSEGGYGFFSSLVRVLTAIVVTWIVFLSLQLMNADLGGFFASAVFAIIVMLAVDVSKWLIGTVVFLSLFGVLMTDSGNAHQGMYIYPFAVIPFYVAFRKFLAKDKGNDISGLAVAAGTAVVGFVVVMIVDGIEVKEAGGTNWLQSMFLTWKNFLTMTVPFKPNYYAGGNTDALARYEAFFGWAVLINVVCVAGWFLVDGLRKMAARERSENTESGVVYTLPKIDLTLIIVTLLTVYMAIEMRRFVTVAGVLMSPFIALFIEQGIRIFSSVFNRKHVGSFIVRPMPMITRNSLAVVGSVFVIVIGLFWGVKYHRIYLSPFVGDNEARFSTVFMRMTASNVKPFKACEFIRENELSGNMFNYWTEGGFIAYGQRPDPNTGMTPLKLFMDGRAQAAYDPQAYQNWMSIMSGGPELYQARRAGKAPTAAEYKAAGQWIDNEFDKDGVWVVLMPAGQFDSAFMKSLESLDSWKTVFLNNKQKIVVDTTTEKGQKLFNGIFDGSTEFPDEFSKDVTIAHTLLRTRNPELFRKGYQAAKRAVELNPSYASARLLEQAAAFTPLRDDLIEFCKSIDTSFRENMDQYKDEHGYRGWIITEITALQILMTFDSSYKTSENREFMMELNREPLINIENIKW